MLTSAPLPRSSICGNRARVRSTRLATLSWISSASASGSCDAKIAVGPHACVVDEGVDGEPVGGDTLGEGSAGPGRRQIVVIDRDFHAELGTQLVREFVQPFLPPRDQNQVRTAFSEPSGELLP